MASDDFQDPHNPFSQHQPPAQPKSGPNVKLILLIVCAVGLIPLLCCGGFVGTLWYTAKTSPAVTLGLPVIQADATCRERLGEPIEKGMTTSFNTDYVNGVGSATATFNISGPQGAAVAHCEARKDGGDWRLVDATVEFNDGSTIDLLDENAKPLK